jgi:hydroxymethylpyrimidine pyrophosphatase-like HAD family hydrolase
MPNDLPMFDWAGRSYAVANAHPAVLAAASARTAANDDDGVASCWSGSGRARGRCYEQHA